MKPGDHEGWMVTLVKTTDPPSVQYMGPFLNEQAAKELVDHVHHGHDLAMYQKCSIPHSMYKRMKKLGMK